tara:strand:- start:224 stop:592 length:369 start_codon:yes stop_codon:yes gene_type:complete
MDDTDLDTYVGGTLYYRGPIGFLAEIFDEGGVETTVSPRSLRFEDFPGVKITYVGNHTPDSPYEMEGECYETESHGVTSWCRLLSEVLSENEIAHQLTHFGADGAEIEGFVYEDERASVGEE